MKNKDMFILVLLVIVCTSLLVLANIIPFGGCLGFFVGCFWCCWWDSMGYLLKDVKEIN